MSMDPHCTDDSCQDSADRAVKKVFAILGVDVDRPESVEEFREDLRFGKKLRRAADHGFFAVVGMVAIAMAVAVWVSIIARLEGH